MVRAALETGFSRSLVIRIGQGHTLTAGGNYRKGNDTVAAL